MYGKRRRSCLQRLCHLFFAISRAALISGESVRRGSEILKNGCYGQELLSIAMSINHESGHLPVEAVLHWVVSPRPPPESASNNL
jgi:hypothetical protein